MTEKNERLTRKQNFVRHTVPIVLAAAAVGGAGIANTVHPEGHDHSALVEMFDNDLHFSPENNTITTQSGDELWSIANMVEGSENVSDLHVVIDYIKSMPENAGILNENGDLRTGVQVYYPYKIEIY